MRAVLLMLFASGAALADGAFPSALQVLARPSDAQRIYLGTTFGLVFSEDGGASWRYVCEPYVTGGPNVVLYALQADGALLALSSKLTRSADRGCTWQTVAPPAGTNIIDVFADPADATRALAVAWPNSGSGVWISHDGAQTFPTQLFSAAERIDSVESAAGNPSVIYAATVVYTASEGPPAVFRSGDGGANWFRSSVVLNPPIALRILTVSDANTIYLRAANPATGFDQILASTDGAATFQSLLVTSRPLTGFARGPDGTLYASDGNAGLLVHAPGAASFMRQGGPHLLCLSLSSSRLFGCGDGLQDPYNLAASDDFGKSWRSLLVFTQIQGPATCPQVQTACAADWQYQQTVLASASPRPKSGCGTTDGGGWLLLALFLAARGRLKRWR